MSEQRHVRLFRNGRNQAVRIPVEFELPGDEAIMYRDGDRLVIEPVRKRGLVALLKTMKRRCRLRRYPLGTGSSRKADRQHRPAHRCPRLRDRRYGGGRQYR